MRLLAFRRGLLKPDYPNGLQSRIREELILFMASREEEVEAAWKKELMLNMLLAPHLDPKKYSSYAKQITHWLGELFKQKQYSIYPMQSMEDAFVASMEGMIKDWYELEKNGTLAEWEKQLNSLD